MREEAEIRVFLILPLQKPRDDKRNKLVKAIPSPSHATSQETLKGNEGEEQKRQLAPAKERERKLRGSWNFSFSDTY